MVLLKIFQDSQSRNVKAALFGTASNTTVLDISVSSLTCDMFKLLIQADSVYLMVTFDNSTVSLDHLYFRKLGKLLLDFHRLFHKVDHNAFIFISVRISWRF